MTMRWAFATCRRVWISNSPTVSIGTDLLLNARSSMNLLGLRTGAQILMYRGRRFSAFRDSPHYKRLPATHITRRKYAVNRRHIILVRCHVSASIQHQTQLLNHAVCHWTEETH